jgi:hypothetical protein
MWVLCFMERGVSLSGWGCFSLLDYEWGGWCISLRGLKVKGAWFNSLCECKSKTFAHALRAFWASFFWQSSQKKPKGLLPGDLAGLRPVPGVAPVGTGGHA